MATKELGLVEQTLRNCIKAAGTGILNGLGGKTVIPEHMDLTRFRADRIRLKRDCEIFIKSDGALRSRSSTKHA